MIPKLSERERSILAAKLESAIQQTQKIRDELDSGHGYGAGGDFTALADELDTAWWWLWR